MKSNNIDRRHFIKASTAGVSLFTFSRPLFAQTESPVATTKYGKVRGYIDKSVNCFKGIRYGADTSARRFMAPLPPEKWDGISDATNYGRSSPQQARGGDISEDCLFLNLFTPGLRDGGKRPIIFYIHGGAYANGSGSSPLYDGVRLSSYRSIIA